MRIPPEKLLPQDMVDVFDHGSADARNDPPVKMRMHACDASHALDVEPARFSLDEAAPAPVIKTDGDDEFSEEDED